VNVLSVAILWVSIAIALVVLLKAQAQNLASAASELEESRLTLGARSSELVVLSMKLEGLDALRKRILSELAYSVRTPVATIRTAAAAVERYGDTKPEWRANSAETSSGRSTGCAS
jgi:uncharacterized protein YoxC